jgi:hypothetical protein
MMRLYAKWLLWRSARLAAKARVLALRSQEIARRYLG